MRLVEVTISFSEEIAKVLSIPSDTLEKNTISFINSEEFDEDEKRKIIKAMPNWKKPLTSKILEEFFKKLLTIFSYSTLHDYIRFLVKHGTKEKDFSNITNQILKDCSTIVKIYKKTKKPIYRGIGNNNPFLKSVINKNREPLFLGKSTQKMFDNILLKNGFSAVRGNSIFTTADKNIANTWGDVYIVFPFDGFEFTWFKNLKGPYVYSYIDGIESTDEMKKIIKKLSPTNKNLSTAILNNQEILITGSNYYAISIKYKTKILKWLETLP